MEVRTRPPCPDECCIDQQEHFVGASYSFGIIKVLGSWQNAKVDPVVGSAQTNKLWSIGAQIDVGPSSHSSIGYAKADVGRRRQGLYHRL
ncbi:hypothetical protein [Thauera sp. SWB20]|jgi:predicted porin|uniref:hypothetical protein n=1 Tax=Thauera sp. SWB20 TaxID=1572758 RepID=UPI0005ADCF89|nr:hypothetical protein [Thauera sp. SWB20]KIN91915.1 putative porin transmembrane domain protein [Thauera sp. SWB20]